MATIQDAKKLEALSKWRDAANVWAELEMYDDADACIKIAKATEKGDAFRAEVERVCGPEPQVENKKDSVLWMKWYEGLRIIYHKHFKLNLV